MPKTYVLGGATTIALLASVISSGAVTQHSPLGAADLTNTQKRAISQAVGGNEQFVPPTFHASMGAVVPESIKLSPVPEIVAKQIPSIGHDEVAALKDQDVLLVRPQDRKVVGVIEDWADASLGG